jgi:HK97 family phage portal protein
MRSIAAGVLKNGAAASAAVGAYQGGFIPSLGSMVSAAGVLINQGTAMAVSAVYACVSRRSKDVSRCTPRLFSVKPKSGTKEQVFEHDLVELFKRPNAQQSWIEWCEQTMSGYLLRGGGFAALKGITQRGQVTDLIPINPDAVVVLESWNGEIFYNVNRMGLWQIAMLREFQPALSSEQMFHLRGLSFNALVGLSNIHIARDAIGVSMGLEQQAARWMANGARPAMFLKAKNQISEAAAKRLKVQIDEDKSGLRNTGGTIILEEGMEAQTVQLTSTDIAFIEQRKYSVEDICRYYDVPPFKLGATELRGIDIEEINNDYVSGTIMPDLHRLEQTFGRTFDLERQNLEVSFDERALLRSATKTRFANNRIGLGGASFLTVNEVRAGEQLPAVDGGDVLYQPSNLAGLGSDRTGTAPDGAGRPPSGELPDPHPAPAAPAEDDEDKTIAKITFKDIKGAQVTVDLDEANTIQVQNIAAAALKNKRDGMKFTLPAVELPKLNGAGAH